MVFKGLIAATASVALMAAPTMAAAQATTSAVAPPRTRVKSRRRPRPSTGSQLRGGFIIPLIALIAIILGICAGDRHLRRRRRRSAHQPVRVRLDVNQSEFLAGWRQSSSGHFLVRAPKAAMVRESPARVAGRLASSSLCRCWPVLGGPDDAQPPSPAPRPLDHLAAGRSAGRARRLSASRSPAGPCAAEPYPLTGMLFHHLAEYEPADRTADDRALRPRPRPRSAHRAGRHARRARRAWSPATSCSRSTAGRFRPAPSIAAEPKRREMAPARRRGRSRAGSGASARAGHAPGPPRGPGDRRFASARCRPASAGSGSPARTQVNAFANGRTVVMTTAMLKFLRSDDELAVVLGHEMPTTSSATPPCGRGGRAQRGLGLKASAMWKREEDADRFGLRLMAAAGYDRRRRNPLLAPLSRQI